MKKLTSFIIILSILMLSALSACKEEEPEVIEPAMSSVEEFQMFDLILSEIDEEMKAKIPTLTVKTHTGYRNGLQKAFGIKICEETNNDEYKEISYYVNEDASLKTLTTFTADADTMFTDEANETTITKTQDAEWIYEYAIINTPVLKTDRKNRLPITDENAVVFQDLPLFSLPDYSQVIAIREEDDFIILQFDFSAYQSGENELYDDATLWLAFLSEELYAFKFMGEKYNVDTEEQTSMDILCVFDLFKMQVPNVDDYPLKKTD